MKRVKVKLGDQRNIVIERYEQLGKFGIEIENEFLEETAFTSLNSKEFKELKKALNEIEL